MKHLLLLALLSGTGASAQPSCPPPQLRVFYQQQPVALTGSPLVSAVTLTLDQAAACQTPLTYEFKTAQLTLVRAKRRLLPPLTVTTSHVDLTAFRQVYHPGDIIYVELHGVTLTAAPGRPLPYPLEANESLAYSWVLQ
ncbi:hypothetical protein GO988_23240 [Hymenobacter sp. HMF4947]|uniref:Uncharacterized protein n=1 Tax=Hymenobacter ginkgonis TaxID=2682976 RepID=A0A7K1TLG2_9BACT|nr:hypothetical protein [Hymenobacter ginkgonis]MVN79258.1 hypothetical protein [Hymenobacter ginkgonis]